jgi:hypothetical protein
MDKPWQPSPEEREASRPELSAPALLKISGTELEKRAAQVGRMTGTAVAVLRDVRRRLRGPGQEGRGDRLSALGAVARTRAWELRREAAERTEDWRHAALDVTAELRRRAKDGYEKAWDRARQTGRDYPVHVAITAGVAGFLIGAGLRMRRRSHRAG